MHIHMHMYVTNVAGTYFKDVVYLIHFAWFSFILSSSVSETEDHNSHNKTFCKWTVFCHKRDFSRVRQPKQFLALTERFDSGMQ